MRGRCRLQDNIKIEGEEMWTISTEVNWARTGTGGGFCDKRWRTYKLHKIQYRGLLKNVRKYQLPKKGSISCIFCWTLEWWSDQTFLRQWKQHCVLGSDTVSVGAVSPKSALWMEAAPPRQPFHKFESFGQKTPSALLETFSVPSVRNKLGYIQGVQ